MNTTYRTTALEAARKAEVVTRTNAGTIKVCPRCGDPVIYTLEFPGVEYVCVGCQWAGDLFAPHNAPATADRERTYETRLDQYERERATRKRETDPAYDLAPVFSGTGQTRCVACSGTGLAGNGCRCHGGDACATCGGSGEVDK